MTNKRRMIFRLVSGCLGVALGLVLVTAFELRIKIGSQATGVILSHGTFIAENARLLDWDEWQADPAKYENMYVEVQGVITGGKWEIPECGVYQPRIDWGIGKEWPSREQKTDPAYFNPKFYVQNELGVPVGLMTSIKVTVWGFMRRYEGKAFCQNDTLVVWYLEALKVRVDQEIPPMK